MRTVTEAIHLLEDKLKNMLSVYEFLKEENEVLLQNTALLQRQLEEKQQFTTQLQEQYGLLKIAKTITGSSEDTKATKLKINALIREIDKCIIQLNQ